MDWNDQKYCEIWRHEWEVIQNRYLEANDRPERVDLRSYARQGLDIVPLSMRERLSGRWKSVVSRRISET
ncbi:MobA/MobL protein [human gut metagenome]|uniref:MobA/MobL protein n=1 Tax=human gut metagenome TaxID=408170 RepID=K1V436_9ZZZZ